MTRDNVAFLAGGIAFGFVFGFGVFHTIANRPDRQIAEGEGSVSATGPAGPRSPTQMGGPSGAPGGGAPGGSAPGGAPMVEKINDLKRRLAADPRDLRAVVELANLYHDVGMFQQAIGFYEQALAIEPGNPDLLTDMGICYQGLKQHDRAVSLFAQARARDANHWQSRYNSVVVLAFSLGRFDEAEAALRELDGLRPGSPEAAQLRQALGEARAGARGRS